ncbi:lamin tail domain-containing protein [Streptomyces sp. NPDC004059]
MGPTNASHRNVNLDGWTLSDDDDRTYTLHHFRLEGRATVPIHTGIGRDSDTDLHQNRRNTVWDEDVDTATLRDDRGRCSGKASTTPVTALAAGATTRMSTVSDHREGLPVNTERGIIGTGT